MFPWVILAGIFIAIAFNQFTTGQPVAGVIALVGPVVIFLFSWVFVRFRLRPIRLEITESTVRARQGNWHGQPDMEMPRSQIRAIHYFPRLISFRGLDDKPVMMIYPQYTLRQMRKVAAELDVRLFDHTRWLGLRKIKVGRLAYVPASGPGSGMPGPHTSEEATGCSAK
jgi:hypothetical protein